MRSTTAVCSALGIATLTFMLGAPTARAQEEAPAPEAVPDEVEPAEAPEGVEEIVVRGRKREELIQDTPISMVALSAFDLENRTIERIDEIGKSVANLKFDSMSGSNSSARIYIRGVGQDRSSSLVDPGVGLYIDGVYLPRTSGGLVSVVDLEQVEVLRGPQGTLYGKNTAGGIINMISKKPGTEFGGYGQVRFGNYDLIETRWAVDIPLNFGPFRERVFTRLAFATATNDGWVDNVVREVESTLPGFTSPRVARGQNVGDNKLLGTRFALRALPRDDMIFDFTADWSRQHENARTTHCAPANAINAVSFLLDNFTGFRTDCAESLALPRDKAIAQDLLELEPDTMGLNGSLEWELGSGLTLKTINAWRRREQRSRGGDLDGNASTIINAGRNYSQHDHWQHELQLNASLFEDRLNLVSGFFWFKEKSHSRGKPRCSFFNPRCPIDIYPGEDPAEVLEVHRRVELTDRNFAFLVPDASPPGTFQAIIDALDNFGWSAFETTSYAGYVNFEYQLAEGLSVETGVRRTIERKSAQGRRRNLHTGLESFGLKQGKRFDSWTPMARLTYHVTEDVMAYLSYARGWKSGGFNNTFVNPAIVDESDDENMNGIADAVEQAELQEYEPEIVDAFEVGIKTGWFDNRLTANLSVYYYEYDEIQLNIIEVVDGVPAVNIKNAAEAELQGFELELRAIPIPGLILSAGIGHIKSDYQDFPIQQPVGISTACENLLNSGLTGRDVTDVPGASNPFNAAGRGAPLPPESQLSVFNVVPGDCPLISGLTPLINPAPPEGVSTLLFTATTPANFSDREFKHAPSWDLNFSATYAFELFDYGRLSLSASWHQMGQVWFDVANTASLDQGKFGELDGRISFELADGNTVISLWAKNILDRVHRDGVINLGESAGGDGLWWGAPRTYGIELRRSF